MNKKLFELLDEVHANFKGDTEQSFKVCFECGGKCQYNKVCCLVPGEAEYMADKSGVSLEMFKNKFLDGVMIDGETVDILKCIETCPFLKPDFSCGVKNFKPLLCLIYPLIFEPDEKGGWKLVLDRMCPLAQDSITAHYFANTGKQMIEAIKFSPEWLRRIYEIDGYDYDYEAMTKNRRVPLEQYKVYGLDELLSFRI